jgi:aminoglycoside 3-N-acetyltransferase I
MVIPATEVIKARRLGPGDRDLARTLFTVMAGVFEEECGVLSDAYIDHLLNRIEFWAIAAFLGDQIVGGLTAHSLPMSRVDSSEIFIYDIAVYSDFQRRGIGRLLVDTLRDEAEAIRIHQFFVAADNADFHALEFYRALRGEKSAVTFFTFTDHPQDPEQFGRKVGG